MNSRINIKETGTTIKRFKNDVLYCTDIQLALDPGEKANTEFGGVMCFAAWDYHNFVRLQ